MTADSTNLNRRDVLDLLDIASDMRKDALSRLLTKYCEVNKHVRFASLWRFNSRANTISIYARSKSDYLPQLGDNGEYIQEFLCSAECPSVAGFLSKAEYRSGTRTNHSIKKSGRYGLFHPKDVADKYDLDEFVVLPIQAAHAPGADGRAQNSPRFFCLFYCPLSSTAEQIADIDLDLIHQCLGNMIYNRFNESRWKTISKFTEFISVNHDPDSSDFLDELKLNIPCQAVFEISKAAGKINISSASSNEFRLSGTVAQKFWSLKSDEDAWLIEKKDFLKYGCEKLKSIIAYQSLNHEEDNRSLILFCNKVSESPFATTGQKEFTDDFGFDDVLLAEAVGEHVRAFSLTKAERKRREDVTRIIAHEIKQPLIDIRNSIGNFQFSPERFGLRMTIERIQESTDLALLLAEMNTELTDENVLRSAVRNPPTLDVNAQLNRMKRSLRGLCEDFDFKNDNIEVRLDSGCDYLAIARSLLATIFLNTVSNSVKYSTKDFFASWCSVRLRMVDSNDVFWQRDEASKGNRTKGLLITTTDNGIGIPEAELDNVFGKEHRLHSPNTVPGLGLGLFHLRRTVEALDGQVWMHSNSKIQQKVLNYSTRVFTVLPDNLMR